MPAKSLTTLVEELNNVLTVVAMCTDELESPGVERAALTDLRDAVRRGAELTRALAELRPKSVPPAAESDPATSDVHAAAATIVVIDDDTKTRHEVVGAMNGRGWRIIDAASVGEATHQLESVRAIDVLVIDTTSVSRRFASQVADRYPRAAVIYTGGYTDDAPLRKELPKADVTLLCRPFEADALVARVSETIARRRPTER